MRKFDLLPLVFAAIILSACASTQVVKPLPAGADRSALPEEISYTGQAQVKEAIELFKSGDRSGKSGELMSLACKAGSAPACTMLAVRDQQNGNMESAEKLHKKACKYALKESCDVKDIEKTKRCTNMMSASCMALAQNYYDNKDVAAAQKYYSYACKIGRSVACYNEAAILEEKKKFEEAYHMFKKGCDDHWAYPEACLNTAIIERERGNKSASDKYFSKACSLGVKEVCPSAKK
ncbi:hypothetical protein Dip518_000275 [Parelusimicrobium proximum]|uniref:hypothetical protein n=1 Tax=Parelusimicrobium proximum TaxID=3228953 RepID=UPI003D17C82F